MENLERCITEQKEDDIIIIGTDANAQLKKRSNGLDDGVSGMYGSDKDSKTGAKLRELLSYNHLCSATTFFMNQKNQKDRSLSPTFKERQIDHFFVRRNDMKRIKYAGIGWNGVDSDHKAVTLKIRIAKNLKSKSKDEPKLTTRKKLDLALFRQTIELQKEFNDSLKKIHQNLPNQQTDNDSEKEYKIDLLKTCMKQAGEEVIPVLIKKRKEWFKEKADILEPLIKERDEATKEYMNSKNNNKKQRLQNCRKKVKKSTVASKKIMVFKSH